MPKKKFKLLIIGAQWYGNWANFAYRGFLDLGVDAKILYTNTLFSKLFLNQEDKYIKVFEKSKKFLREHNKYLFNKLKNYREELFYKDLIFRYKFLNYKPDLILFVWRPPNEKFIQLLKRKIPVPLALWLGEPPETIWPGKSLEEYSLTLSYFDYIFFVVEAWKNPFKENLKNRIFFLPFGSDPAMYKPVTGKVEDKFCSDIAFVGLYLPIRAKTLSNFKDYNLKIYGYNWEKSFSEFPELKDKIFGSVLAEEVNLIFNNTKINIGSSFSGPIGQRTFDIALAGGFQLSEYRSTIKKFFGDSIPCFNNEKELKTLVDYYLKNEEERKQLAIKSHKIALRGHTFKHRAEEILSHLNLL
jgi:spore maturation protein CgeB